MEAAEEMIAFSIDERGIDAFNSSTKTINGRQYSIINPGEAIYTADNSTVILEIDSDEFARVNIDHLGSILGDGSSIIMAAVFRELARAQGQEAHS